MDITEIFDGLRIKNPEGVRFGDSYSEYVWLTNGLGQYSFRYYDPNEKELAFCIENVTIGFI